MLACCFRVAVQFALIPTPSTSDVAYCLVNSINGADIVTSASPRQFVDYARQALNSTASAGYVMRALASHPAYASLFGADNADQLFAAMRLPIDSETGYPAIVWYPAPAIASAYRVDNPAVTPTDLLTEFAQVVCGDTTSFDGQHDACLVGPWWERHHLAYMAMWQCISWCKRLQSLCKDGHMVLPQQ